MSHTPGKWVYELTDGGTFIWSNQGAQSEPLIAVVESSEADASLIAAAPTAHAAAIRVVSAHRTYPEDLPTAIDALWRVLCEADPQLATDAKD